MKDVGIPVKLYRNCLQKVFERLDRHLVNLFRVCKNLHNGFYSYPEEDKFAIVECNGYKFELIKDSDDIFNIVYYVNMIITENRFWSPFERCLESSGIEFNYKKYPHKIELFDDFIRLIEIKYGIKPKIILHKQYIVFRVLVLRFVKTERLAIE